MCVTSPPYFGLRDYGHKGQIGLEQTPEEYIAAMVEVFRCVRDVLADDGTLWVNIGDSYASKSNGPAGIPKADSVAPHVASRTAHARRSSQVPPGFKHKDLIGIPWMLAFALRADGWFLRQDIIWHKPNPMPESVRDRCTKAHEYIFLLSKGPRYFFDQKAVKEPSSGGTPGNVAPLKGVGDENHRTRNGLAAYAERLRSKRDSFRRDGSKRAAVIPGQSVGSHREGRSESDWDTGTRNKRSVWSVPTRGYKGAHFAVFPPALIEPCILAGSRPGDVVLDPFMGSGTTAAVSLQHGRQYLGCELNTDYEPLQTQRIEATASPSRPRTPRHTQTTPAQRGLF